MEPEQLFRIRHSLSHLLAMAVLERFPEAKLGIGPAIDTGFYYDFELPRPLQPDDLPALQKSMEKLAQQDISFVQSDHSVAEAQERFKSQPYKTELIKDLAAQGEETLGYYTSGSFIDLCKGPHVVSTKEIPVGAFELSHVAGAYWRGDEKRPMLQRIYGLAFATATELEAYKTQLEEAKKRDHRKLGAELDLFTFSDLVGSGLPLWTPKGTLLRQELDNYVWELRSRYNYDKVEIPHITKKELYERSGHWEKFQNELFRIKTREGHEFVMKPMNCPHHTQIFARKKWSYRDLPQRYANTTTCYRDEQTGELNGLSRVRSLTQDDSHIFCRYSQAKVELSNVWNIIEEFYATFGFTLKVRLSFHDPANMSAYIGEPEVWKKAEKELQELAEEKKADFFFGIGEAAFYGPKIDFMANDSLGRQWQVATIQLDMNMPDRFGLTYAAENGQEEPVLMIHAAIMGSLERFLSIIIEHVAGNFPFWLAPVQVAVLPVNDQSIEACQEVATQMRTKGLRVFVDTSAESVGKKIREASLQKIPAKIVIGAKEIESKQEKGDWNLMVNWRSDITGQSTEVQSLSALLEQMVNITKKRAA